MKEIQQQYYDGLITNGERRANKVVDIWDRIEQVAAAMMELIENHKALRQTGPISKKRASTIYIMADSGARGGHAQLGSSQVCVVLWRSHRATG